MFCTKCGAELRAQDKFSHKCGQENVGYVEEKKEDSFFFAPSAAEPAQATSEFRPDNASSIEYTPSASSSEFSGYGFAPAAEEKPESSTMGTLALVFSCLGGMYPGLILAIIGLCKYKQPKNRKKCKIAIGVFIGWIVVSVVFGMVLGVLTSKGIVDSEILDLFLNL